MFNHLKRYCSYCSSKKKKRLCDWQKLCDNRHGSNEYLILSEPSNNKDKVSIKHRKCGREFERSMVNHIHAGQECPYCSAGKKDTRYWKEMCKNIYEEEYEILGLPIKSNDVVLIKHNKCGRTIEKSMDSLILKKRGCKYCYQNFQISIDKWQERCDLTHGKDSFLILKQPRNLNSRVFVRHTCCNNEFETSMSSLVKLASGCYFCNSSKGENKILIFLKERNIEYKKEKTFDGCKHINKLRFDFYLPKYNLCIEYDGIHHFIDNIFDQSLVSYKEKDEIKNKFCIDNNIDLVRIPYTDYPNIDRILIEKLNIRL